MNTCPIEKNPGQVPVILITGIAPEPMAAATIALQWDVECAVTIRHEIEIPNQRLVRTVSDAAGVLERAEINITHACINCATRDDLLTTLERLAISGRWRAIIAQLPIALEGSHVCRAVERSASGDGHFRIAAVIAALEAPTICHDLLGDELLIERGLPVRDDDDRGVGEVGSAMVEYADLTTIFGNHESAGWELLRTLARPGAQLTNSLAETNPHQLLTGIHCHEQSEDWVSVVRREDALTMPGEPVWTLDIRSDRPLHPERLQEQIESLGRGRHRSRGCFWLPTRPSQVCQWDGAGGMVSIGHSHDWERSSQLTRITIVGIGTDREKLSQAFNSCLLTDAELAERGRLWEVDQDGLEPWLGPIPSRAIRHV
jgi:G3E family GTPase